MAYSANMGPVALPGGQNEGPPFKLYIAGVPKDFTAEQLQPSFDPVSSALFGTLLFESRGTFQIVPSATWFPRLPTGLVVEVV